MRHLIASLALFSALALSCAATCDEPAASGDAADLDAEDDGCDLLNCGDYGACRDPLPVCCNGKCQRAACGNAGQP